MTISRSSRRARVGASLLRSALVVAALVIGACVDAPLPMAPAGPSDPSRLLVATPVSYTQMDAGARHTCAVTAAGAVACWGDNGDLQSTVPPSARSGMAQVSAGGSHTCAVSTPSSGYPNRSVFCWGRNNELQTTVRVGIDSGIVNMSAGAYHSCAIKQFQLYCWGANGDLQSSFPDEADWGMVQVSAGGNHTCAVSSGGAVLCWGAKGDLQSTVPASAQSGMAQVSAGGNHTCALSTAGAVSCWGANGDSQSTVPSTTTRVLPTATFGAPTAPVVVGQSFTLTLTDAQVPGHPEATAFTYAFDCGTGTYAGTSTTASRSCATPVAGALTVRGKVIDQSGDIAAYTASVTVLSAAQATAALRDRVATGALVPDLRRALTAKLDDALKALAAGKTKPACGALADFASQVQAQRGKAIAVETADAWLAETAVIRTAARC
jgi:hypothetical protein